MLRLTDQEADILDAAATALGATREGFTRFAALEKARGVLSKNVLIPEYQHDFPGDSTSPHDL